MEGAVGGCKVRLERGDYEKRILKKIEGQCSIEKALLCIHSGVCLI